MKYSAVLFDMDGTILDTLEDMNDSINATLEYFGLEGHSLEDTRRFVGNGAERLVRLSLPQGVDEQGVHTILEHYKAYYNSHSLVKTAEYEGITPMLRRLKAAGMKLAVVSNKPDATVKLLSEELFGGLFESAVGESASVRRKPSPDAVIEAIRNMGESIENCVYVGDSEVDIETARNAGLDCISVTWGFRDRADLIAHGASVLADSVEELEEIIRN